MKRTLILLLVVAAWIIPAAKAQSGSSFSIGPRISSYSTHVDGGPTGDLRTGRQTGFGLVGGYRNGALVLDFDYDNDPTNDAGVIGLIVNTGDYQRSRAELTVGYALLPTLDIQGGFRKESVRLGGFALFGTSFGTDFNLDHQAIVGGIRLHSPANRPAGFYVLARGYAGTAKFDDRNGSSRDTTGYRAEVGVPIVIGDSNWSIVPGVEYDHFETKDPIGLSSKLRLNTNRAFINFVFTTR